MLLWIFPYFHCVIKNISALSTRIRIWTGCAFTEFGSNSAGRIAIQDVSRTEHSHRSTVKVSRTTKMLWFLLHNWVYRTMQTVDGIWVLLSSIPGQCLKTDNRHKFGDLSFGVYKLVSSPYLGYNIFPICWTLNTGRSKLSLNMTNTTF